MYTFEEAYKFYNWRTPDLENCKVPIVLWGAGRVGGVAEFCLRKKGYKVAAFCDIAKDKWGTKFCNTDVISPEELREKYSKALIIISTVFYRSVVSMLKEFNINNYFDASFLFMEIDFSGYDFWMEEKYAIRNIEQFLAAIHEQVRSEGEIDQIFLNITTKCSLRCRDCSMFIPYVKEPKNYDKEDILKDCSNLLECLGSVRIVNVYGGEPLLHPDLPEIINRLKGDKRIKRISIITNATIVPSEELIKALKGDERIWIRISDYGKTSRKMDEIKKLFDVNHIVYEISNYTYWDRPSTIKRTNETAEQLVEKFKACTACNVFFLLNRKVYVCSTGSAVNTMGVFPEHKSNCVDLGKYSGYCEEMKQEIDAFLNRVKEGKFIDACRYCSGGHCCQFEDKVPAAIQTTEIMHFESVDWQ